MTDKNIVKNINSHRDDEPYLREHYKPQVRDSIVNSYDERELYESLTDPTYTDEGSIFDMMTHTVIQVGAEIQM